MATSIVELQFNTVNPCQFPAGYVTSSGTALTLIYKFTAQELKFSRYYPAMKKYIALVVVLMCATSAFAAKHHHRHHHHRHAHSTQAPQ